MAEYHHQIEQILLEFAPDDESKFLQMRNSIIKALPPKDRMVYNYMRLLTGIGWGGLMGTLFNSDGKSVRDYREAIQLSGSGFLLEKFDKAIQLYKTKHGFLDPNSFSGILEMIKSALSMRNPAQDETAEEIDEIGEEIDNWEGEEMEATFYRLANGCNLEKNGTFYTGPDPLTLTLSPLKGGEGNAKKPCENFKRHDFFKFSGSFPTLK